VNDFKQGVWWIELAALTDPSLVPQAMAHVLGVQGSPHRPMVEMLTLFIRDKRLLMVLDTCEHLVKACAELAEKLLLACPNLKIIATSQEPLKLPGEIACRVPNLRMPDVKNLPPVEELGSYDAIQLFVQRASAVAPNWKLNGNARAVAQICARLDGIPLAIELARAAASLVHRPNRGTWMIASACSRKEHARTAPSTDAARRHRLMRITGSIRAFAVAAVVGVRRWLDVGSGTRNDRTRWHGFNR
jgi:predicted ATPase